MYSCTRAALFGLTLIFTLLLITPLAVASDNCSNMQCPVNPARDDIMCSDQEEMSEEEIIELSIEVEIQAEFNKIIAEELGQDPEPTGTLYYDPNCPLTRLLGPDWKKKAKAKGLDVVDLSTQAGRTKARKAGVKGSPELIVPTEDPDKPKRIKGPGGIKTFLNS